MKGKVAIILIGIVIVGVMVGSCDVLDRIRENTNTSQTEKDEGNSNTNVNKGKSDTKTFYYDSGEIWYVAEGKFNENGDFIEGKMTYDYGRVFEGTFNWETMSFSGKFMYENGEVGEGIFDSYGMLKEGKLTKLDGTVSEGMFNSEGDFIKGNATYPDGTVVEVIDGEIVDSVNNQSQYTVANTEAEPFIFKTSSTHFEITFGEEIKWDKIKYTGRYHKAIVFGVAVTVKNLNTDSDSLGRSNITQYNPNGVKIDSPEDFVTDDDDIRNNKMRSGASFSGYMYFLYDGDGDYYVEFYQTKEIKIAVKMPTTEETIVGEWVSDDDISSVVASTYIFKADGTYEHYTTVLNQANTDKEIGAYKISDETITFQPKSGKERTGKIIGFENSYNTLMLDVRGDGKYMTLKKQ